MTLHDNMYDSIIEKKSFEFSVRIYDLHKYLVEEKKNVFFRSKYCAVEQVLVLT